MTNKEYHPKNWEEKMFMLGVWGIFGKKEEKKELKGNDY